MLRINRKPGQSVIVTVGDEKIVVTVTQLERSFARLSFEAPESVIINRAEIDEERKRR